MFYWWNIYVSFVMEDCHLKWEGSIQQVTICKTQLFDENIANISCIFIKISARFSVYYFFYIRSSIFVVSINLYFYISETRFVLIDNITWFGIHHTQFKMIADRKDSQIGQKYHYICISASDKCRARSYALCSLVCLRTQFFVLSLFINLHRWSQECLVYHI